MKVTPVRFWISRSSERMCWRSFRSRADSGSSSRRTAGSTASARAMAMRWRWPPDSSVTFLSAISGRATSSSSCWTRRRRSADAIPRTSSPKPIFSATVISGKRARFWKISAVGRLFGPMPLMSLPPIRITPNVGSMKPEIMRRIVVLPQPDGPRKLKNSPAGMVRCTSETAVNAPKRMVTWSSSMSWLMKPRSKGAIPRRGSSTRDGAGPSRRQEAVLVFVADRDVPRFLDRPPPQLIQRVTRIGLGEELLVEVAQMSFRPLGRGVDAGVVGVECTRLRRIVPVDPFIGLGEVLRTLGDAEAFHPGKRAFFGCNEADGQVFLTQAGGGAVPGLADDAAIGAESALGLVLIGPELADRCLVVEGYLDDGVEVGAGPLL